MAETKTEKELLSEISKKLDRLIGLTAIQNQDEESKIQILYGLGFDSPSIGALLGLSADAVRKRKSRRKGAK